MTTTETQPDYYKWMGEWSLAAGRSMQSKQTGYVHYYYGEAQKPFDTIPLMENVLFVLALLRSRLMEPVQEAKVLLNGLLNFQNLVERDNLGNFPIYIHEFPFCRDPSVALQLLAPFYWILHQFGHILGSQLKTRLTHAVRAALDFSLSEHNLKPFPYSLAIRLASARYAFGNLWELPEWKLEGKKKLEELAQQQLQGWISSKHLGSMLIGLQMAYPSFVGSEWEPLWYRMEETWHRETGTYIGPSLREWQDKEEPEATIYDLFAGYFSRQFSRRATLLRPYHLYGSLLQPSQDRFNVKAYPFETQSQYKDQKLKILSSSDACCTLFEKKGPSHPSVDKTFTPFRLIWGDLHRTHTFVCQGGTYEKVDFSDDGRSVQLIFALPDHSAGEETRQKREIEFFVDFHPGILFRFNGQVSNTFELGEEIQIERDGGQISLVFDLLEGEGDFLGHLMRGNRPSQIDQKGENRFQAYDWTLFLRTIRRRTPCRLRATLTFQS